MTEHDLDRFTSAMNDRWPMKFSDEDLLPWCRELARFKVTDIIAALDTWKNRKPFAPKIDEIKAVLKEAGVKPASHPNRTRRGSALVESIIAANPHLALKSDHELVAAQHRRLFTDAVSKLDEWAGCETPGKCRDDIYRARFDSLAACTVRVARTDLLQIGVMPDVAHEASMLIVGDDAEYQLALKTLNEIKATATSAA